MFMVLVILSAERAERFVGCDNFHLKEHQMIHLFKQSSLSVCMYALN